MKRERKPLTEAQARALQTLEDKNGSLRHVHWTTARVLQQLGLCKLGPGRSAQLTPEGRQVLAALGQATKPEGNDPGRG